jgi:spore coat polysaccharide biosynthesis predicted glycosyltransferase SpsG
LIKTKTLDSAIEKFEDFGLDSVISVVDDRHLSWGYDEDNERYFPNYIERVNREDLPKSYRETGAILATRRAFVQENSRLGTNIGIVEVSREESVNIETYEDWWRAENYLRKKKIALVVNASSEIGTSHIDRCLAIASKLVFHEVLFLIDERFQLGVDIVGKFNYSYRIYEDLDDMFSILKESGTQIVVNDILDTPEEYVSRLKEEGYFVVNFEDLGMGSEIADVVFDDLYEHDREEKNVFTGYKYFILNDEFYYQPAKIITNEVKRVMIAFGEKDANNLTELVIDSILSTNYNGRIDVIVGLGYDRLDEIISKYESNPLIQIYRNVSNISEFMFKADIIFTSSNKSIYEICSIGIPTICLCQDIREETHAFANQENGFINLGLGEVVEKQDIIDEFIALVNDYELRRKLHERMLAIDLRYGFENITSVVEEEYRKFEFKRNYNRLEHEDIQ